LHIGDGAWAENFDLGREPQPISDVQTQTQKVEPNTLWYLIVDAKCKHNPSFLCTETKGKIWTRIPTRFK